jgi:hypothetical protein
MKYLLLAIPTGYAVAYHHASAGLVALSEHWERSSAEAEVQRLNAEHQARLAIAASSLQQHRQHAMHYGTERRSVRWVPDDEFA